jgi:hypothetical protein
MHFSAWKASDKKLAESSHAKETQRGICGFRQPGDLVTKNT